VCVFGRVEWEQLSFVLRAQASVTTQCIKACKSSCTNAPRFAFGVLCTSSCSLHCTAGPGLSQIVVADLWAAYGFKTCDSGVSSGDVALGAFYDVGCLTMFGPHLSVCTSRVSV
jgi:hypothetical protein